MTDKDKDHDKLPSRPLHEMHEPGGKASEGQEASEKHTPSKPREGASDAEATGIPPHPDIADSTGKDADAVKSEAAYWAGARSATSAIAREDAPFGEGDKDRDAWLAGWDFAQGNPDAGKAPDKPEDDDRKRGDDKRKRDD
jgi:hypothetical protein